MGRRSLSSSVPIVWIRAERPFISTLPYWDLASDWKRTSTSQLQVLVFTAVAVGSPRLQH
jgi:hypothetical protein